MKVLLIENANLNKQLALSSRLISFSNYLVKEGNEVYILCGSESHSKIGQVEIIGCNSSTYSPQGNLKFLFNAKRKLKDIGHIDIAHSYQPNLSSNAAVFVSNLKRKYNTKLVNDIRSLWVEMGLAKINLSKERGEPIRKILYSFEKFFLKTADHHFFITQDHKEHYQKMLKMNFQHSSIIPNTLENFEIQKEEKINQKVVFGYIGSLQQMRGLEQIIKVFSKIKNVELHLYGSPELNNLPRNVHYKGYANYEDIPSVLATIDVGFAHVSNNENYWYKIITNMSAYPRKILEYMAASLPILASNQLAHTKTFNDLPILYNSNDINDLREKIIFLRDNEDFRKKKSKEGYNLFQAKYSLEVVGKKIRKIYKKMLN